VNNSIHFDSIPRGFCEIRAQNEKHQRRKWENQKGLKPQNEAWIKRIRAFKGDPRVR